MTFDVAVVGGGTAGCVLAARLSQNPDRRVCLIEAGPDYGHLSESRWPADLLDPRSFTFTHDWGAGGEDERSLGARVIGGCSVHNACMALAGTAADYDEWGEEWSYERFAPYLDLARRMLHVGPANTPEPAPFHAAFLEAAAALGLPFRDDPHDLARPTGVGRLPANVVDGVRWSTALAYLDDARSRPNLTIVADTLVDRVVLDGTRAVAATTASGERIEAATVVLAARTVERLEKVAAAVQEIGGTALVVPTDITDDDSLLVALGPPDATDTSGLDWDSLDAELQAACEVPVVEVDL